MALSLDRFSATGHVALLVRIQVGRSARTGGNADQIHLYATDGFTPEVGTVQEGDFDYDAETGTDYTNLLRRIALNVNAGGFFILNRSTGLAADLDAIVGAEAVTVVRETTPPTLITLEANSNDGGAGGFVDWRRQTGGGLTDDEWSFLNDIAADDEIILAFHAGTASYTVPPEALAMEARAGSPTASFNLTAVPPPNLPPVVTIDTQPQTLLSGQTIQLSASALDPDGTVEGVLWSGGGTFSHPRVTSPEWTAPTVTTESVFTLVLRATDDDGAVGSGFLSMTVRPLPLDVSMSARAGNPTAAFNLAVIPPTPPEQLSMSARAGNPTAAFDLRAVPPGAPAALSMSARAGLPTAGFDLSVLQPSPAQQLSMAARAGDPTASFNLTAIAPAALTAPRFLVVGPTGAPSLDLAWLPPLRTGGTPVTDYEVQVVDSDGAVGDWESIGSTMTRHRVRGLAFGRRVGVRVRARTTAPGPETALVYAVPAPTAQRVVPAGREIPLLDVDRQSLIIRVGGRDCRVRVWWQPLDRAWYGALEVPVNTLVVSGRRLVVDGGLLDRLPGVLPGNVVCRPVDDDSVMANPVRDAWCRRTHVLRWEPD